MDIRNNILFLLKIIIKYHFKIITTEDIEKIHKIRKKYKIELEELE